MIDRDKLKRVIRKTGTKKRVLYTYSSDYPAIRKKHEAYANFIDKYFIPSIFSHAYTKNRSIYTNAIVHLNNDYFVKVDVKNFFPSINHRYLVNEMYYELNKKHPNTISLSECAILVEDSSISGTGLPLGLILSPILSNLYMKRFDGLLYGQLKRLGLEDILYTRYADDIFISFKKNDHSPLSLESYFNRIIKLCEKELGRCHLKINEKKTRRIDLSVANHVKVAGINIARLENGERRLTVSRKTVRDLYYRALAATKRLETLNEIDDELNEEISYIKGMHSFVLSIEKTGYSHVLSNNMNHPIRSLGYKNLEELIASMRSMNKG